MNNILISSAPQPSSKVANTSQPDSTAGANNDQTAPPFAKVLARKVEKSSPPPSKTNSEGDTPNANPPVPEQAPVPVDALSAILQIPVEMRGTTVMERVAQLASGDRTAAALDPLTTRTTAAALTTAASHTLATTKSETELTGQNIPAAPTTATDKPAASKTSEVPTSSDQKLLADALQQTAASRPALVADSAPTPQISAASLSQATVAAMTGSTSNQPATATQTISTPVNSPTWGEDFSQKVSWMVTQKTQVAELHLNPPNLGPLDVTLKISDNQATAVFASPHAAVRDAVENALPKLRELLADNGIMLSNASVGDQAPRDQKSETFADRKGASSSGGTGPVDNAAETSGAPQTVSARRHNGIVDTFA